MDLGGYLPARRGKAAALVTPELAAFERFLKSTEEREISTTMAFVQILQLLLRDKNLNKHIVPIVPDESRTFGMPGGGATSTLVGSAKVGPTILDCTSAPSNSLT